MAEKISLKKSLMGSEKLKEAPIDNTAVLPKKDGKGGGRGVTTTSGCLEYLCTRYLSLIMSFTALCNRILEIS